MTPLLLSLVLLSANPKATGPHAAELARKQEWDQLLLTFATEKPQGHSPTDAAAIALALTQACEATERTDAVIAFDLGRHAADFQPLPNAYLCWARAAEKLEQVASAEEALKTGRQHAPHDGRFGLALGKLYLKQGEADAALEAFHALPARSREAREAQPLLRKAEALRQEDSTTRRRTRELEARVESGAVEPPAPLHPGRPGGKGASNEPGTGPLEPGAPAVSVDVGSESGEGPGGIRTRDSRYFHFKYFVNARDFGQRADFEGRVASALEAARRHCASELGVSRESPVDVILYTREEFALHMGEQMARMVAGLYSQNAIRINGGMELSREHQTTLAHEYVHSVVDELAQFHAERVPTWMNEGLAEYLGWRFEGRDEPVLPLRNRLHAMAQRNALPSLTTHGMLIAQGDPGAAYAFSALAARFLLHQAGPTAYVRALRALGEGHPLEQVFPEVLGRSVEEVQRSLASDLSSQ